MESWGWWEEDDNALKCSGATGIAETLQRRGSIISGTDSINNNDMLLVGCPFKFTPFNWGALYMMCAAQRNTPLHYYQLEKTRENKIKQLYHVAKKSGRFIYKLN